MLIFCWWVWSCVRVLPVHSIYKIPFLSFSVKVINMWTPLCSYNSFLSSGKHFPQNFENLAAGIRSHWAQQLQWGRPLTAGESLVVKVAPTQLSEEVEVRAFCRPVKLFYTKPRKHRLSFVHHHDKMWTGVSEYFWLDSILTVYCEIPLNGDWNFLVQYFSFWHHIKVL